MVSEEKRERERGSKRERERAGIALALFCRCPSLSPPFPPPSILKRLLRPLSLPLCPQASIAPAAPSASTASAAPEVTPADQAAINDFNRAFASRKELAARLKASEAALADLEDAALEVGLADVDAPVRMVVGECFAHLGQADAEARVEAAAGEARDEAARLEAEAAAVEAKMDALKKGLYAKFGNSINLEE